MENKEHSLGILKCMFYSKAFNELEPHKWSVLMGSRQDNFLWKSHVKVHQPIAVTMPVNVSRRWWKNVGGEVAAAEGNVLFKVCKACFMILILPLSYSLYQTFISELIFFLSLLMLIPLPKVSEDFEVLLKRWKSEFILRSKTSILYRF